ncbi:MAG: fluoride efflux transporter CrcB [Cellulomonadaceae bacterium]|jgi:CrcB protein|nr:fluoride efflux transporter CrcB [Cellulomonadaceae bacterium]
MINPIFAVILVALGGGVGAATRYGIIELLSRHPESQTKVPFPFGTIIVNLLGSFLIGVITGLVAGAQAMNGELWRLLLATGFCGGFTTFSTATVDFVTLQRAGQQRKALLSAAANLVLSLVAVGLGLLVSSVLNG